MTKQELLDKLDDVYGLVDDDPDGVLYDDQMVKDFLVEGGLL